MGYWLFKTEPDAFSIVDLQRNQVEMWDGIRNYQARNFLRDKVKLGDQVFIYHSSCKEVGIAGVARVVKESYPDPTQFDANQKYYDAKSSPDNPRWVAVDVEYVKTFKQVLSLKEIKSHPEITEIGLVKKGGRLSIMPVEADEWDVLMQMASR